MKPHSLCLLFLLLLAPACRRRAPHSPGLTSSRPPVTLVSGIGRAHFPIQTANREAQDFFNQGLNYIYAFNHDEARRSFERAAALDPAAPMPLWGVALAVSPNYNDVAIDPDRRQQAFTAITRAEALAQGAHATPRERDYIQALARRYAPAAGQAQDHPLRGEEYARAMAALSARYPDDLDAATLYAEALMDLNAWNLWSPTGAPRPSTPTIVATLQSVLARDPNHVGANHLLIHAVEASKDPRLALPSAQRLPALAPAAGHLVHMPSHIEQHIGDYHGSASANQQAVLADDAYYRSRGDPPVGTLPYDSYRVHNLYFLVAGCSMEGNDACAQEAAAHLAAYVAPAVPSGKMNQWFLASQPWMLVRFGHWQTILGSPPAPSAPPALAAMTLYARACAFAATHRLAEAQAAHDALVQAGRGLPASFPFDFGTPAAPIYQLAGLVAQARILEAESKLPAALDTWRQAVALQDKFGYSEPPDWYFPVRESLGGALLRARQPQAAEAVFRRDLARNPGNGRSLFGLWQALLAQHRRREADQVQAAFTSAWSHADVILTVAGL